MSAEDELLRIAADVAAQAGPGEQIEAYVSRGTRTQIKAYDGEVESLTQATSAGIGIRVVADDRTGFAWTTSLDPEIVAETLAEARDNRPFAEPDPYTGLAEPDGVVPPTMQLVRPGNATTPLDDKIALAVDLERRVRADQRISGIRTSSYTDASGTSAIVTSTGISATGSSTIAFLSVLALAADGDAAVTGAGLTVGREPGDLDVDEAATDAIDRVVGKLGSTKPESATVTLLLEPRMTVGILGTIAGMLSGERVAKGRTPFADRMGDTIGSPLLTIVDDPTDPDSLGAEPYDDEGLASRRVPLLDGGVLRSFLHNAESARRLSSTSTASAVRGISSRPSVGARALAVRPGEGDLDSIMATIDDGVLVQAMTGFHSGVNPVSGDFSVGVEGLRIRNGERAEPIKEATIASTLQRLLLDVAAVGADVEWQPGGAAGVSLAIPGVALSGR